MTTRKTKGKHEEEIYVPAKLMLMWRFLEPSLGFFLTLSQDQKLEVKREIWRQIDSVFDLDQLKGWDEIELETYDYHKPENEVAEVVKEHVDALEPEPGFGLTIDPDNVVALAYNKHNCKFVCCDHGYPILISTSVARSRRPWVIPSRNYPQITVQVLAVLVWESPFPPEWRISREKKHGKTKAGVVHPTPRKSEKKTRRKGQRARTTT